MTQPLRIGLAGLGTVGTGVFTLLSKQKSLLAKRGAQIEVVAVSARNRSKHEGLLSQTKWVDDPLSLATDPSIDVVVELIGGAEGIARTLCTEALHHGKHVITANKALIAHHGVDLARLAEEKQRVLAFEAAVAGGIPVIKTLSEGLAANQITSLYGILNGTCNYILTTMKKTGRDFSDVLKEAQALGYAEADPSFDIDGIDTAHKLAILSAIAFGHPVSLNGLSIEGIQGITAHDIRYATELGLHIKLLGVARNTEQGILHYVYPCAVPLDHPLSQVDGVYNAVVIEGNAVGTLMLEGRGAGAEPTASAVIADIVDIACGRKRLPFNRPVNQLEKHHPLPITHHKGGYYIRLAVQDHPGVLASITDILRDFGISIESLLQKPDKHNTSVPIVIVTHPITESQMQTAITAINALPTVVEPAHILRLLS